MTRTMLLLLAAMMPAIAYPPAPPATIFGKIRGQYGFNPSDGETKLLLLANGEAVGSATLRKDGKFGENYRLSLPLDLNPAAGTYKSKAVTPQESVNYSFVLERNGDRLPISRVEATATGDTPEATSVRRIDFTIGEDTDGDGLPDEWERFQATALDGFEGDPLDFFSATGDQDGDGLSDRDEYIAGTFALLFEDGLNFEIVKVYEDRSTEFSFLAIDGKSYRFECSTDLKTWSPVIFSLPADPATDRSGLTAEDTKVMTVIVDPAPEGTKAIYRLRVD